MPRTKRAAARLLACAIFCLLLAEAPDRPQAAEPQRPAPNEWLLRRDGADLFPLLDFTPRPRPEASGPLKPPPSLAALREQYLGLDGEDQWRDAARLVEAMLEKNPDDSVAAATLEECATWLASLAEEKAEGQALLRRLLRRHAVDPVTAFRCAYLLSESYLYVHAPRHASVRPGERATVAITTEKLDRVKAAAYRVDLFEMQAQGVSLEAPGFPRGAQLYKAWEHRPKQVDPRKGPPDEYIIVADSDDRSRRTEGPHFVLPVTDTVELPLAEPGAYLVTLGTEDYEWRTLVLVSRLALATTCDGRLLIVQASDGGPSPGACEIGVFDGERPVYRGRTNADGLFVGRVKGGAGEARVIARRGDGWAVASASLGIAPPRATEARLHVYTDRPAYRPGQTVHLKAILRRYDFGTETWACRAGDDLRVVVRDAARKLLLDRSVTAGALGTAALSLPLPVEPPLGRYEATVSGGGASRTISFSVEEYRKPEFEVEVSFDRPRATCGETVRATIAARYYFGKPVRSGAVTYDVCAGVQRRQTETVRPGDAWFSEPDPSRSHAFFAFSRKEGKLGADGTLTVPIETASLLKRRRPPFALIVTACVTDPSRRAVRSFGSLEVVPGAGTPQASEPGSASSRDGLQIQTDASLYRPGDTARVTVAAPPRSGLVLITLEGTCIEGYRLARIDGASFSFDQPLGPWAAPQVRLVASGPWGPVERVLCVAPVSQWVKVGIEPDRPEYRPGQRAACIVRTVDYWERPVSAELSLALVDEAIYAAYPDQSPDIRKAFLGVRRRPAQEGNSAQFQSWALGRAGRLEPAGESVDLEFLFGGLVPEPALLESLSSVYSVRCGSAGFAPVSLRRDFADTALWLPGLRTDETGRARIAFRVPDNLTTWRAKAIAVTGDGRVGQTTETLVARKRLMVRLECPRTFTERDEATVSAVVHNYLPTAKRCTVRLKADGGTLLPTHRASAAIREVAVDVPPDEERRVDWSLAVTTFRPIRLRVDALTDEESDAMKLTIPVVAHGLKVARCQAGSVDELAEITLALPRGADLETARLRVSLSPTLGASVFEGLGYLVDYPYGCAEQTMSRFLPCVVVAQVLQRIGKRDAGLEAKLPDCVAKGLERLYGFQHEDGGWGWWKDDSTDPFMSAYVVYGLAVAREADFRVGAEALRRGADFLARAIPGQESLDLRAYMLFAFAHVEPPRPEWLDALHAERGKLGDAGLALLALACHKAGQADRARDLLKDIESRAIAPGGGCHWREGGQLRYSNAIETTSYALRAMAAIEPRHRLLPATVVWLMSRREGDRWSSTRDTAAAIFALADCLAVLGDQKAAYRAAMWLNRERVWTTSPDGDGADLKPVILEFGPDRLQPGSNVLRLRKSGSGSLFYSCTLEHYTREENVAAGSAGLAVTRDYSLVVAQPGQGAAGFERRPLRGTARSGDEIEVVLTVEAERDCGYLMIEDYLPAGCEIVDDRPDLPSLLRGRRHGYANREAHDEKMVFFKTNVAAGAHAFAYTLRAETPGRFHVMPARAVLMYQPEVRGSSAEDHLAILP